MERSEPQSRLTGNGRWRAFAGTDTSSAAPLVTSTYQVTDSSAVDLIVAYPLGEVGSAGSAAVRIDFGLVALHQFRSFDTHGDPMEEHDQRPRWQLAESLDSALCKQFLDEQVQPGGVWGRWESAAPGATVNSSADAGVLRHFVLASNNYGNLDVLAGNVRVRHFEPDVSFKPSLVWPDDLEQIDASGWSDLQKSEFDLSAWLLREALSIGA